MRAVAKDPRARVDPGKISLSACVDFTFVEMQQLYQEKCPTLWRVLRVLGGMVIAFGVAIVGHGIGLHIFIIRCIVLFKELRHSDRGHDSIDSEEKESGEVSE